MKLALHEIYKLGDYFARAQQMITVLRGASGVAGSSKVNAEAMVRRTAWDRVSQEAPEAIRRAAQVLQMDLAIDIPIDGPRETELLAPALAVKQAGERSATAKLKAPSFFDSLPGDDRQ